MDITGAINQFTESLLVIPWLLGAVLLFVVVGLYGQGLLEQRRRKHDQIWKSY